MMNVFHRPLTFGCGGEWLLAIISLPEQPRPRGVLIVVGGPQYRVGSHRQFALLADHLATRGTPVMRFDYRGMGDSSGDRQTFEEVGPDLQVAVDKFFAAVPGLQDVIIWGLCDAASAALFYAEQDQRISGVVLLNPWVRTIESEARAYIRHYYVRRLLSPASWHKLWRGEIDLRRSLGSLFANFRHAMGGGGRAKRQHATLKQPSAIAGSLPDRMAAGLAQFNGRVLLILSGNDLTAKEFVDLSSASKQWRQLLASPRVTQHVLPDATHTFSRRAWRDQVARWTESWVRSW